MARLFRMAFLSFVVQGLAFSQELTVTKAAEWGSGRYQDLVVEGNIAYVATTYGLDIIDVQDPSNPAKLGSSDLPRRSTVVRVGGRYAYLAAYNGLNVLDVSNPTSPVLKAVFAVGADVRDLALKIPYLFIAVPTGFQVLDISNPEAPFRIATYSAPAEVNNISLEGNLACLAVQNGLVVLDISKPAIPVSRSVVFIAEPAMKVIARNAKAYLVYKKPDYSIGGLHIFDLADPNSPHRLGTLVIPWYYSRTGITGEFAVSDNYAFIIVHCRYSGTSGSWEWEELVLVDISNPTNPVMKSSSGYGAGNKLFLSDDKIYVVYTQGSFTVYDVSDPPNGRLLGQYEGGGGEAFLSASGDELCFSFDHGPVKIMDPENFQIAGSAGFVTDIFFTDAFRASQHLLYLIYGAVQIDRVTRRYWLSLYDISDPLNIRQRGSAQILEGVYLTGNWDVFAANGKAYIVFDSTPSFKDSPNKKTMIIVDAADLDNPTIAGTTDFVDPPKAIFTAGHLAYVAFGEAGVRIFDVSNPAAPNLAGAFDTPGSANDIFLDGTSAFVADGPSGICIFDVSNPAAPVFVGSHDSAGDSQGVFVNGNLAYLADGDNGLAIFDVSNPNSPGLVGGYGIVGDAARQVFPCGEYIFVAAGKLYAFYLGSDTPPTVVIKSPLRERTVFGDVKIAADLKDDKGIARLDLFLDGALVQTALSPSLSYEYLWNTRTWADGTYTIKVGVTDTSGKTSEDEIRVDVNNANPPRLTVNLTKLVFGVSQNGGQTSGQSIVVGNAGGGTIHWTVSWLERWILIYNPTRIDSPTSGAGTGKLDIWVDPFGLGLGSYTGTIRIEDPYALDSPQFVSVTLNVYAAGSTHPPFGWFDTPLDGTNGIEGAIPVAGWVLDDIGIDSLKIYREPVAGEQPSQGMIYISDGIFIEGARPDVEQAYSNFPANHRAGWGYMLLTNFLPNQGNGTFVIHAVAKDLEGHTAALGSRTIICDNANAVKPFGTIDTPRQGGTASGNLYYNFGWALTPTPKAIPTDGSTIWVWVDGIRLGHPSYGHYRDDIATLFPGYANSNGAVGVFDLDTTSYPNGIHNIAWSVTDSAGQTDGIGSRIFSILNTGGSAASAPAMARIFDIPRDVDTPVYVRKGFDLKGPAVPTYPAADGARKIEISELERLVVYLNFEEAQENDEGQAARGKNIVRSGPTRTGGAKRSSEYAAYHAVGDELRPLPIGSTFDAEHGILYWQPGPGFIGEYEFVLSYRDQAGINRIVNIHLTIRPR